MSKSTLESRYRKLLALYPAEHRRLFGDEMLGVLMRAAQDGQRHPRLGESIDLLWHALWKRMGATVRPQAYGPWSRAAAVAGVVGTLSMFTIHVRVLVVAEMTRNQFDDDGGGLVLEWLLLIATGALTLIVLFGSRRTVIAAAWLTAVAEVTPFGAILKLDDVYVNNFVLSSSAVVVLLLTTAIALSLPQPAREGRRLLGKPGILALSGVSLVASGLGDVAGWVLPALTGINGDYLGVAFSLVAMMGGMAVLWWRLDGPVRRRAMIILFPAGACYLLAFLFWLISYTWLLLSTVAVFTLLCLMLVKRWERLVHH